MKKPKKRRARSAQANHIGVDPAQGVSTFLTPLTFGRKTASGENVTADGAMALSAYYACLNNISQDLAKLPLQLRQRREGRGSDEAVKHPVWPLVRRRPNPLMGPMQFRMTMQHRLLAWGNAYAEIVRDGRGNVVELWPVHPVRIKPVLEDDGRTLRYEYRPDGKTLLVQDMTPRDIFHLRGLGSGIEGYSVLRFASESLGLGLAAQRYAGAFYGEGMSKRLVAVAKQVLSPKGREAFRERLKGDRENDPVGARKLPFLEGDIDLKDVGVSPDEAQFLESRTFSVPDIARWFRMALGKIQHEGATKGWNSIEAYNRDYYTDALQPWASVWEEECWLKLLTEGEQAADRLYFQHVFQAMLRADFSQRYEGYVKGVMNGWLSPNDVRQLEDMEPIADPWADEYRQQAQMQGSSSAQTSTFGTEPEDDPPEPVETKPDAMAALRPVFLATALRMAKIEANESARAATKHAGDRGAYHHAIAAFRASHAGVVADAFLPICAARCELLGLGGGWGTDTLREAYLALPTMDAAQTAEARAAVLADCFANIPAVSVSA